MADSDDDNPSAMLYYPVESVQEPIHCFLDVENPESFLLLCLAPESAFSNRFIEAGNVILDSTCI